MLDFGQNLLRIRTTKGLNQLKLAEMVGLSQASISQFEKGSRQPTPAIVKKIAKELDIPLEELVGEDGPEVTAAQHLMRNLKGLSPAAIEKINAIAEIIREAEIAKRQSKK